METPQKKSFLAKTPSWLLAVFVFIAAAIVFSITDSIMTPHSESGLVSHVINDLIIASGCFLIVRHNPKSIWYVFLICNAFLLASSIVEPNFWNSTMLFPILGGWGFSLIVSIIAAQIGRRKMLVH